MDAEIVLLNGVVLKKVTGREPGPLEFKMNDTSVEIGGVLNDGDCVLVIWDNPADKGAYHLGGTHCRIHR